MPAVIPVINEHIEIVDGESGPKSRIVGHLSIDEIIELSMRRWRTMPR